MYIDIYTHSGQCPDTKVSPTGGGGGGGSVPLQPAYQLQLPHGHRLVGLAPHPPGSQAKRLIGGLDPIRMAP